MIGADLCAPPHRWGWVKSLKACVTGPAGGSLLFTQNPKSFGALYHNMTRKKRADSIDEQVRAMQAGPIHPPSHVPLDDGDLPFFANVIEEFARSEWTAHQLELAAMLARSMADLNREQQALRTEGFIAVRENGTTVENPRARVVKSLTGDIYAGRRSLALHARARSGGDARNVAKRNEIAKGAQDGVGDDLIARPN